MQKIKKSQDNTKYQRINTIYELLSNTTVGMSISELATELNVSTKTIQRDLYGVLSEFGAIKEGRLWKINPKSAQDNLNTNERIVLGILDEMAKNAGSIFYSKAHNLLSQVTQQLEHPIFTGINAEILNDENILLFEKIENAVKSKNEIEFVYDEYNFCVKPLKLAFFEGFWYLLCLDSNADDKFKKFHLKTIKNMNILDKAFEIQLDIEEQLKYATSIWFQLKEPFSVRLLLAPQVRKFFERKPLQSQSYMGEDKDGSMEIEIKITHEMEIMPMILYYIPYIKVLEPEWLGDIIRDKVTNYLKDL